MKARAKIPRGHAGVCGAAFLEAGQIADDGSIYLGFFSGKDWYVAADDAKDAAGKRLRMDFDAAARYAANLKSHGHEDWMLPPGAQDRQQPDIQLEMFRLRDVGALKGAFLPYGTFEKLWYWSSTTLEGFRQAGRMCYQNGERGSGPKDATIEVRCVRAVPRKPA